MLMIGVGTFTYAAQTNSAGTELTVDEISIEKTVYADYAVLYNLTGTCNTATEIKVEYLYCMAIDEAAKTTTKKQVELYKFARDSLM